MKIYHQYNIEQMEQYTYVRRGKRYVAWVTQKNLFTEAKTIIKAVLALYV